MATGSHGPVIVAAADVTATAAATAIAAATALFPVVAACWDRCRHRSAEWCGLRGYVADG